MKFKIILLFCVYTYFIHFYNYKSFNRLSYLIILII